MKKTAKKAKKTPLLPPEKEEFLTTEQLAERWNMSPGTLKNWRMMKRGPVFVKHSRNIFGGALVRYRLSDILAYEENFTV